MPFKNLIISICRVDLSFVTGKAVVLSLDGVRYCSVTSSLLRSAHE